MENVTRKNQLYFDFGRDYDASLENFFFSSKNQVLKNELSEVIQSDQKKDIFISGTSGSGKTFLLNSLLNHKENVSKSNIYIDLSELDGSKDYFADLNQFDLICLDNLDKINKEMEVQTFNLINECKDSSANLIFACNVSPSELSYLPDLVSRLKQMNYFYINEIGDEEVLGCIKFVAKKLDLDFSDDVMEFISKRIRRDFYSIKKTIQDLEKFLYSEKKEPTKKSVSSFFKEYKT
jgi:DnaA regulatory inactivator Hda|tara:strand:- start:450 stop:1157 length:708 start_codon:yes stop_codon:yes gene_type:complete